MEELRRRRDSIRVVRCFKNAILTYCMQNVDCATIACCPEGAEVQIENHNLDATCFLAYRQTERLILATTSAACEVSKTEDNSCIKHISASSTIRACGL